jgi:hypothetical protein
MMELPTRPCCQACQSLMSSNIDENEKKSNSMRFPIFPIANDARASEAPSRSSTMLAKTNVTMTSKNATPLQGPLLTPPSMKINIYKTLPYITPAVLIISTIEQTHCHTSCSDCTHLAPDHQTVPARLRHCSVAGAAFSLARYSGRQDRLSHLPQRRKC